MRRVFLSLALLLAACSGDATIGPEPDALALSDTAPEEIVEAVPLQNTMTFTIGRETFDLTAGICNSYDDGTFQFALGEGPLESAGRVTATIERFDAGDSFETIIALEGLRDDGTSVSWYAQESVFENNVIASVFGDEVTGSATFASDGGSTAAGVLADGTFSVACS